jgi:misacylated tRNA(Ala) deacylase
LAGALLATMQPTVRLYLQDDRCFATRATVVAVREAALACDQSCFYPGGGGQPSDDGQVHLPDGAVVPVVSVQVDANDVLWHATTSVLPADLVGQSVGLAINQERRLALARYHTVLHVLNTIALREYGGWITGAQIAVDYARIDFKLEGLSPALCAELQRKVNAVLDCHHAVTAYHVSEEEFRARDDLLRTLDAKPPVIGGRVRVVAIQGFDAQACGGTHVHNTADVGTMSIYRTENKGKNNKRLYVRLTDPGR